jgi:hypothetical protein
MVAAIRGVMTKTTKAGIVAAAFGASAIGASTAAHADPVGDFTFGTTLYLRGATVDLDGNKTATGGITMSKPANTLTFDVPASAIGSPLPITLHMVGVPLDPNLILYTFNWSGNVDVDGNGHMLTSATGSMFLKAYHTPGEINAIGNVSLVAMPNVSNMVATGDWGTKTLLITDARFYGGYLPASLAGYGLSDDAEICSGKKSKPVQMYVTLNNPAGPKGQVVFMTTGYHQGVSVPPLVVVPPGKKTKLFHATIAAGFTGLVHTTAAGGGGVGATDVQVDPASDCEEGSGGKNPPFAYNPDPDCIQCTVYHGVNDWGERLGLVGKTHMFIDGGKTTTLESMFDHYKPTAITGLAISNSGYIAGIATIKGATTAYRSNAHFARGTLETMGAITPIAISNDGTIIGTHPVTQTQGHAAINYGAGVMELPLPSSFDVYSSTAIAANDVGEVVGAYTMSLGGGVHGFRWSWAGASALPSTVSVPVAINNAGQIAGNGLDSFGSKTAVIVNADNTVTRLGNPKGYTAFQITAMNNSTVVVGVANVLNTTSVVQRAFVWSPSYGFRALSGYRAELPVVDEALEITDVNTIVVHGVNTAGAGNLYILPL